MMNKHSLWFALIGWVLVLTLTSYQVADYLQFRYRGKRFTADDGQTLCERVQRLEAFPKPCEYGQ